MTKRTGEIQRRRPKICNLHDFMIQYLKERLVRVGPPTDTRPVFSGVLSVTYSQHRHSYPSVFGTPSKPFCVSVCTCTAAARKYRSLGHSPQADFPDSIALQPRGCQCRKGRFRTISSRAFFRRIGRCSPPLGCGAIEPGKSV